MRGVVHIMHLLRVGATLQRTGALHVILCALDVPPFVRQVLYTIGVPFLWLGQKGDVGLPPLTRGLTVLGPAYIKFGQLLSTRLDIIGHALGQQLILLQDKIPAFPESTACAMIAAELKCPVHKVFTKIGPAVAAASVAQVHQTYLVETGEKVAVKILRPGIEQQFARDIQAFYFAASMIERFVPKTRRLRLRDVVRHFEGVVTKEMDLRIEIAAAAEFADTTKQDQGFVVPRVYWQHSGRRILTFAWMDGTPLNDLVAVKQSGHNMVALGDRILQLFLRHALRDGYFHADMHQGNLKVAANGDIIALDFGIMGRIDEYTRRVYAEILMGFIRRDYRRVAELHFEAGYVPADRDVDAFAQALRSIGDPIFGMDASRISMARLMVYLFDVTERFGMQTRTELILLQRTMVVVEGVARTLNPNVNIWETAEPVISDYIRSHLGAQAWARDAGKAARMLVRLSPVLLKNLEHTLATASHVETATGKAGKSLLHPAPRVLQQSPLWQPMLYAVLGGLIVVAADWVIALWL